MRHKRKSEMQRRIDAILAQQYAILDEVVAAREDDGIFDKQVTVVVEHKQLCRSQRRADRGWKE